jgi:hypothetical protein
MGAAVVVVVVVAAAATAVVVVVVVVVAAARIALIDVTGGLPGCRCCDLLAHQAAASRATPVTTVVDLVMTRTPVPLAEAVAASGRQKQRRC